MKRFILALLLSSVSLFAVGSVQQTTTQLGTTNTWVTAFTWTGDSSNGTVPTTSAVLPAGCACQGYLFTQVETVPGTTNPTAGYAVAILDAGGADILGGAAGSLSATTPQAFAAATSATPLQGTFQLRITGQSVASAKGTVYVFFSKPGTINLATINSGGGAVSSSANWLTIANPPFVDPRRYNWTPQSPGGSIAIGANTITMNPMPAGITADCINVCKVYLSGGTGTAEPPLITAWTANTITFTAANTHTGAYTVGPASQGIQEAVIAASYSTLFYSVWLPGGTYTLRGKVTIPAVNSFSLIGQGEITTTLRMDSANSTDDALLINSSIFEASGFRLDYGGNQAGPWSTGGAFNFSTVGVIYHLSHLEIFSFAKAVESIGQHGFTSITDVNLSGHDYGLRLRGGGGQYLNINATVASTGTSIDISPTQADRAISGIMFNNIWVSGGLVGFNGNSSIAAINEGFLDNIYGDTITSVGINFTGGAFTIANWRIGHIDMLGASVGIELDSTNTPGVIENIRFTGGQVSAVNIALVSWEANNISFTNVAFRMTADATANSVGIDLHGGPFHGFSLVGCSVGLAETGGITGARPATGLQFGTGAAENLTIAGTPMYASSTVFDATTVVPTITKTVIAGNPGVDDITGTITVSGGGAASFPFNPNSTMNSATAVSSATGLWAGRAGTFVNSNGTPGAWTAGATIGNSCTIAQNKLYNYWFDGTKVWLNGPGC